MSEPVRKCAHELKRREMSAESKQDARRKRTLTATRRLTIETISALPESPN